MGVGVLVGDPAAELASPVLDDEGLGEFLALSVAESALSLAGRHQMRSVAGQSHFEPLADVVLDGRPGAPSAASFLNSNPATGSTESVREILCAFN